MSEPDWKALQQAGRLEQTCPRCDRTEAAGAYCSFCGLTGMQQYWYAPKASASQLARLEKARAARTKKAI